MNHLITDEELMNGYAMGDSEVFSILFERYKKKTYSFLSRRIGSSHYHDVDDLFQISWLKVHKYRKNYSPDRKFSTWLFGIMINVIRDYFRQVRWKYETSFYSESEQASSANSQNMENEILNKDILKKLEEHLDRLSESQKEVVLLSDWEGFSSKEISKMLGLADGAVRQLLFRARQGLRAQLKEMP